MASSRTAQAGGTLGAVDRRVARNRSRRELVLGSCAYALVVSALLGFHRVLDPGLGSEGSLSPSLGVARAAGIAGSSVLWLGWSVRRAPDLVIEWARAAATFVRSRYVAAVSGVALLGLGGSLLVSGAVLESFPNSADEYATLFQAQTLGSGRLWVEPHPESEFFSFNRIFERDGKWIARYPPGWALILAGGGHLMIPAAWMAPIVGALLLLALAGLARRLDGEAVAVAAAAGVALSPFFLFNAGSYFSHAAAGLQALLFALFAARFLDSARARDAALAGLAIGCLAATRQFEAVLVALPALGAIAWRRSPLLSSRALWLGIGALPPLAGLLAYNAAVTGDPFQLVASWGDPETAIGFAGGHSLRRGLALLGMRVAELAQWSSLLLPALYAAALGWKASRRELRFTDFVPLVFMLGFVFYQGAGGNRYGPRYWFESYPFLVLSVASATASILRAGRVKLGAGALHACLMSAVVAICSLPSLATSMHQIVHERRDLFRQVEVKGLHNAVVIVTRGTGVLRYMPIDDLLRNDPALSQDVLFAQHRGESNNILRDYFPEREFWFYTRHPDNPEGELISEAEARNRAHFGQDEPVLAK